MDKQRGLWRNNGQTWRTLEKRWTNIEDCTETLDKQRGLWRNNVDDYGETVDKHRGLRTMGNPRPNMRNMENQQANLEEYGETMGKHRGLWRNNGQT